MMGNDANHFVEDDIINQKDLEEIRGEGHKVTRSDQEVGFLDGAVLPKKGMPTKIMDLWAISKERQENFTEDYLEKVDEIEVHDLFKMIRGSEYRRGKADEHEHLMKIVKSHEQTIRTLAMRIKHMEEHKPKPLINLELTPSDFNEFLDEEYDIGGC